MNQHERELPGSWSATGRPCKFAFFLLR